MEGSRGEEVYQKLKDENVEVLFDDREISAGIKFSDADLLGIPNSLTISKKTLGKESIELKKRDQKNVKLVDISQLLDNVDKIL